MNSRKDVVLGCLRKASEVRRKADLDTIQPMCIYDLVERSGIGIRFEALPSMEGMYCKSPGPLIVLSSLRPSGRQAFTCAHELGHHVYGHGTRVDEYLADTSKSTSRPTEEFIADCFAGALLMPSLGVKNAFVSRGWKAAECSPQQAYAVACLFGVGYSTIIRQMTYTLHLMSPSHASELMRSSPKSIRASILGEDTEYGVVVVDEQWSGRAIDINVSDFINAPHGSVAEGDCLVPTGSSCTVFRGARPGIGRLSCASSGWSAYVRVSKREYVGRSIFRHLEDPDYGTCG